MSVFVVLLQSEKQYYFLIRKKLHISSTEEFNALCSSEAVLKTALIVINNSKNRTLQDFNFVDMSDMDNLRTSHDNL